MAEFGLPDGDEAVIRHERISGAAVHRVCAMLDLDASACVDGAPLPLGWQFLLMAADTPRIKLRADGFPGLGVPMPDFGLPRLVLGARTVATHSALPIGEETIRSSRIASIQRKDGANGPLAIIAIHHSVAVAGAATVALEEEQTYVMMGAGKPSAPAKPQQTPESLATATRFLPDDTLLFQYCALGFNSHKIHLDRQYATDVEGYPDLVVNGGLINLMMTEVLRRVPGIAVKRMATRHLSPAYANRPVLVDIETIDAMSTLRAFDPDGVALAVMEVFSR